MTLFRPRRRDGRLSCTREEDEPPVPRLRALAELEILEGLRSRRQLAVRSLTPIALFFIVLGVTLVTRTAPGTRTEPLSVAVQGDLAGAQRTLQRLQNDQVRFVPSNDATLDAARTTDAGLIIPDRLDDRLERGEQVHVVLTETALANQSRSAAALVRAGFGTLHQQDVLRELGQTRQSDLITIDAIDVQRSTQAALRQTSSIVTALVLLQASMLVGSTATRLLSRNNRGLLHAQLLLPFERWRLALSKGFAELVIGSVAAIPVLLVVVAGSLWTGLSRDGALEAVAMTAVSLLTFTVLAMAMTSIGLVIGARSRTQEQVSLASALVVVLTAIIASQIALGGAPPNNLTRLLPIVGSTQTATLINLGWTGQSLWLLAGTATTLLFSLVMVRLAGRGFSAERLVLREAS